MRLKACATQMNGGRVLAAVSLTNSAYVREILSLQTPRRSLNLNSARYKCEQILSLRLAPYILCFGGVFHIKPRKKQHYGR